MRRVLGVAAAAAMALMVSGVAADDMEGTISDINVTASTFMLDGKTYAASPTNTVGVKLSDLQNGDKVRISVAPAELNTGKQPFNVMALEKVE